MRNRSKLLARVFLFAVAVLFLGSLISNLLGNSPWFFTPGTQSPVGFSLSFIIVSSITLVIFVIVGLKYALSKGRKLSENISTKSEIQKKITEIEKNIKSVEYKIKSYEEIEKTGTMTADEKNAWRELAHEHLRLTRELSDLISTTT